MAAKQPATAAGAGDGCDVGTVLPHTRLLVLLCVVLILVLRAGTVGAEGQLSRHVHKELHVLALVGEKTEGEEQRENSLVHFLHSACRLGFPNVEVLRGRWDRCAAPAVVETGGCESMARLEARLSGLPPDELVIVANLRGEYVYLVQRYEDALGRLEALSEALGETLVVASLPSKTKERKGEVVSKEEEETSKEEQQKEKGEEEELEEAEDEEEEGRQVEEKKKEGVTKKKVEKKEEIDEEKEKRLKSADKGNRMEGEERNGEEKEGEKSHKKNKKGEKVEEQVDQHEEGEEEEAVDPMNEKQQGDEDKEKLKKNSDNNKRKKEKRKKNTDYHAYEEEEEERKRENETKDNNDTKSEKKTTKTTRTKEEKSKRRHDEGDNEEELSNRENPLNTIDEEEEKNLNTKNDEIKGEESDGEENKTTKETRNTRTGDEEGRKEEEEEEELNNLLQGALRGGAVLGRAGSLLAALRGHGAAAGVLQDKAGTHILFGGVDRIQGALNLELPLKVTFHPHGGKKSGPGEGEETEEEEEERRMIETTEPLLVYSNKEEIDLYNILEAAGRTKEEEEEEGAKDPCPHIPLQDATVEVVVMNLFLGSSYVPFLEEVLKGLTLQEYPKEAVHVWIYGKRGSVQETEIKVFVEDNRANYASITLALDQTPDPQLLTARCAEVNCSFVALVEPRVALNDPNTLAQLVYAGRPVVGPFLKQRQRGGEVNFVAREGEEQTQWDDLIRSRAVRGTLRVAEVKSFRLVHRDYLQDLLQGGKVLHYISTRARAGLLLDPRSGYKEGRKHPDLWGVRHNPTAWRWRYVHPDLQKIIRGEAQAEEVGKDLYYVPLFTERFCRELVEEMEHYGRWQDKEMDDRDESHRYTSTNINLNQIDFADEYHLVMNSLHRELLATLYGGYRGEGRASLLFVLRYIAAEDYNTFTYHLDGATYTLNVALNDDFAGGGLEYRLGNKLFGEEKEIHLAHNRTGWGVVQPDRPYHLHHGVPLISGRRYALIAIVDTNDAGSKGGPLW